MELWRTECISSARKSFLLLFIIQISLKLADSMMTFINAMKRFSVISCAAKHEIALLVAAVNSCRDVNLSCLSIFSSGEQKEKN